MFKIVFIIVTASTVVLGQLDLPALPVRNSWRHETIRHHQDYGNRGDGTYRYVYKTSDGTAAGQFGYMKTPDTSVAKKKKIQAVTGYYRTLSPDGKPLTVTYSADENGFRAEGSHLPTPPPIPPLIQESLDLIQRNRERKKLLARFGQAYTQDVGYMEKLAWEEKLEKDRAEMERILHQKMFESERDALKRAELDRAARELMAEAKVMAEERRRFRSQGPGGPVYFTLNSKNLM